MPTQEIGKPAGNWIDRIVNTFDSRNGVGVIVAVSMFGVIWVILTAYIPSVNMNTAAIQDLKTEVKVSTVKLEAAYDKHEARLGSVESRLGHLEGKR